MMRIKRKGFTTLECVISLFIVSMIVFIITSTLHNNIVLLKKNNHNRQMLYIAKEQIEDERNKIKKSRSKDGYDKVQMVNNFKVKTLVTPISYYNCYDLRIKVSDNNREMELNTYVTKKE
ncbi:hypothetical protein [Terrisporobacter petrolearius]|uniref:hypothetical protein n=1 Tax=Terrisporobacter petrolearius TaxID=1460447 RepID=UPI003B003BB4